MPERFAELSPCKDELSTGMFEDIGGFVSCSCGCRMPWHSNTEEKSHTQRMIFSWLLGFPQLSVVVKNAISDTGELQPSILATPPQVYARAKGDEDTREGFTPCRVPWHTQASCRKWCSCSVCPGHQAAAGSGSRELTATLGSAEAGATLCRWIPFLKLCFNFLSFWYQCLCFNELSPPAYQTSLIPCAPCLQFPVAPNQELCCLILPVF